MLTHTYGILKSSTYIWNFKKQGRNKDTDLEKGLEGMGGKGKLG